MKKYLLLIFAAAALLFASCSSNDTYYFKIIPNYKLSNGKEPELKQYIESKVNLNRDLIYESQNSTEAAELATGEFNAEIADIDDEAVKSYLSVGDEFTLSLKMWAPESQVINRKKWSK